jgi:hypothetical protein
MKIFSLKLPHQLAGRLAREARHRNQTKSDLVRAALEAYLDRTPNGRRHPLSAADLARDRIGCLEGPEDLATNPAHMEGFGT